MCLKTTLLPRCGSFQSAATGSSNTKCILSAIFYSLTSVTYSDANFDYGYEIRQWTSRVHVIILLPITGNLLSYSFIYAEHFVSLCASYRLHFYILKNIFYILYFTSASYLSSPVFYYPTEKTLLTIRNQR